MQQPSRFFWYELVTDQPKAAADFYARVVGWEPKPYPGGPDYTLLHIDENSATAGIMQVPDNAKGMPPQWLGYLHAADVDAKAEQIRQAGGTIHKDPQDIPDIGRFAVATDPDGVGFMIMTPTPGEQALPAMGTPGTIGWHELSAGNLDEAFAFYSGLFGWTRGTAMPMGELGTYQLFHAGDGPEHGGMMAVTPGRMPSWLFYFTVEAIDAAAERVRTSGGTVTMEPMEVPGGAYAMEAVDPHGARFGLTAARR